MDEAIIYTQLLILRAYATNYNPNIPISYEKTYLSTNENIDGYLKTCNYERHEKALSVLASGDQAFNLITKGIKDIDTFDINKLSEYYALGFKRALIIKYDYLEFFDIYNKILNYNTDAETIGEIINDLLPYMDLKYRIYWRKVLDFYVRTNKSSEKSLNLFNIIGLNHLIDASYMILGNCYLHNEVNYCKLRKDLTKANITFKAANAINLAHEFNHKYDYLLLSNILDYVDLNWGKNWTIETLNQYLQSLKPIMNEEGIIFLYYSIGTIKIGASNIYLDHNLKGFETINVKHPYAFKNKRLDRDIKVVLKRVKDIE